MITKRYSDERGPTHAGWLESMHTFSFGGYYDPNHMGYGPLRVINEDRVAGGSGFGTHPHRNMEIVSYVLEGALEHRDSMGNGSVIRPGDVQRMSAGVGVTHSEFNPSKYKDVRFLQIWFLPEKQNMAPNYAQQSFSREEKQSRFKLVMSPDGRDNSIDINQAVDMYVGLFNGSDEAIFKTEKNRIQWIQIASGEIDVNGDTARQGDGLAVQDEPTIAFDNASHAEVILFDMNIH